MWTWAVDSIFLHLDSFLDFDASTAILTIYLDLMMLGDLHALFHCKLGLFFSARAISFQAIMPSGYLMHTALHEFKPRIPANAIFRPSNNPPILILNLKTQANTQSSFSHNLNIWKQMLCEIVRELVACFLQAVMKLLDQAQISKIASEGV